MEELLFGIAATSSLRALDPKGEKLAFNTEGWKEAMELVADAVRSRAVFAYPLEEDVNYLQTEPFLRGEVAMVLGSGMFLNQMLEGRGRMMGRRSSGTWSLFPSIPHHRTNRHS